MFLIILFYCMLNLIPHIAKALIGFNFIPKYILYVFYLFNLLREASLNSLY